MRNLVAVLSILMLGACAMKTKILDAGAVSMTKTHVAEGEKLQEVGPVSGKFCPDSFNDKGSFGLIDQSVKEAQTQTGVDWILNASVWRDGNCITVEGTGAKIASAGGGASAAPMAPAAAPAPMKSKKTKK